MKKYALKLIIASSHIYKQNADFGSLCLAEWLYWDSSATLSLITNGPSQLCLASLSSLFRMDFFSHLFYSSFIYCFPTIVSPHHFPPRTSLPNSPFPQITSSSFSFSKGQASQGYQSNMAYKVIVILGTTLCTKSLWRLVSWFWHS